jgi:DnaJ-class molecular chaperone
MTCDGLRPDVMHPDPTIDAEVRADMAEASKVDAVVFAPETKAPDAEPPHCDACNSSGVTGPELGTCGVCRGSGDAKKHAPSDKGGGR